MTIIIQHHDKDNKSLLELRGPVPGSKKTKLFTKLVTKKLLLKTYESIFSFSYCDFSCFNNQL